MTIERISQIKIPFSSKEFARRQRLRPGYQEKIKVFEDSGLLFGSTHGNYFYRLEVDSEDELTLYPIQNLEGYYGRDHAESAQPKTLNEEAVNEVLFRRAWPYGEVNAVGIFRLDSGPIQFQWTLTKAK